MSSRECLVVGEMKYELGDNMSVREIPPTHCLAGHPQGPWKTLVGWDGTHRTYTCRKCDDAGS
jgi:hypothetical protein